MDLTPLLYLQNAGEVTRFASMKESVVLLSFACIWFFVWFMVYKKWIYPLTTRFTPPGLMHIPALIGCIVCTLLPVRGGTGVSTMSLSSVYYSKNTFSNHAAVNVVWNIIYHITERKALQQQYDSMPEEKVLSTMARLFPPLSSPQGVLRRDTPNVILIILESFTKAVIENRYKNVECTPSSTILRKR
jgi:hypothetical protein